MRKLFIAGNWKMNLNLEQSGKLAGELREAAGDVTDVTVALCPPFIYLNTVSELLQGCSIAVGGQNMHPEDSGAYTGEISAPMLLDAGCEYVIVGHSERRHVFGESDDFIAAKAVKAVNDGLKPIICVGETLQERQGGLMKQVVCRQVESALEKLDGADMADVTLAYEPVWAIGTGHTATPEQAEEVHAIIRSLVADLFDSTIADHLIIQYGGSVKPDNAKDLLSREDVDGALVGGASLESGLFLPIIDAARSVTKSENTIQNN